MQFTNDETNLMFLYNPGKRKGLISALTEMRKHLAADETELIRLTDSVIYKLEHITDAEFEKLELTPDFDV